MAQRMHRTQIYLTNVQYFFLHSLAEKKCVSVAEIIRGLIDKCLPQTKDYQTNDLFSIGKDKFVMKQKNGSVNHDEYIYRKKDEQQ